MDLERDDLQGADDLVVKADERRMEMRRGKIIAVSLTVCAVGAGMTVNAYAASTTFEMRKKSGEPAWNYNVRVITRQM